MLGGDRDDSVRPLGAFSTVPFSAQFSASVALPVKATLPPVSPIAPSTCARATSIAASASRPQREGECGLANRPRSRDASPSPLRARPASSPDNRDRSCRLRLGAVRDAAPLGEKAVDIGLAGGGPKLTRMTAAGDLGRDAHRGEHALGFMLPDEQALPADTAIPARSSCTSASALPRRAWRRRRWSAMRGAPRAITTPPAAAIAVARAARASAARRSMSHGPRVQRRGNAARSRADSRCRADSPAPARRRLRAWRDR